MKSPRFVNEKIPSCEDCKHYKPTHKQLYGIENVEMAHGLCLYKEPSKYKQRGELCKKYIKKGVLL